MMIKKIVVAGRWCCCTVHVTKESLILTGLAINDGCRSEDRKVRLATRTIHCWCWCSGWPTITINSAKCIDRLILLTRMVKKHRRKVRKEWTQCNCFRNLIWLKRPHLMRRDVRCDWRRFYFALVQIWWQEKSQSSSVQLYGIYLYLSRTFVSIRGWACRITWWCHWSYRRFICSCCSLLLFLTVDLEIAVNNSIYFRDAMKSREVTLVIGVWRVWESMSVSNWIVIQKVEKRVRGKTILYF